MKKCLWSCWLLLCFFLAPPTLLGQLWPAGHCSVLRLLLLAHLLHRLRQLRQCRAKPPSKGGAQGSEGRTGRGETWIGRQNNIQPDIWLFQVLYLLEKVLIFLPEALSQRWQYHRWTITLLYLLLAISYKPFYPSIGRLMSKLLHPGNSWKLLKREAMRLFLLWYAALGEQAGDQVTKMPWGRSYFLTLSCPRLHALSDSATLIQLWW